MRCYAAIASRRRGKTGFFQGPGLPGGEIRDGKMLDLSLEHPVEVELRVEVQKHGAKPDRSPVHEHEFPRHGHGAFLPERLVDPERFTAAVLTRLDPVGDGANAIFQK